jgi:hypothetical protein
VNRRVLRLVPSLGGLGDAESAAADLKKKVMETMAQVIATQLAITLGLHFALNSIPIVGNLVSALIQIVQTFTGKYNARKLEEVLDSAKSYIQGQGELAAKEVQQAQKAVMTQEYPAAVFLAVSNQTITKPAGLNGYEPEEYRFLGLGDFWSSSVGSVAAAVVNAAERAWHSLNDRVLVPLTEKITDLPSALPHALATAATAPLALATRATGNLLAESAAIVGAQSVASDLRNWKGRATDLISDHWEGILETRLHNPGQLVRELVVYPAIVLGSIMLVAMAPGLGIPLMKVAGRLVPKDLASLYPPEDALQRIGNAVQTALRTVSGYEVVTQAQEAADKLSNEAISEILLKKVNQINYIRSEQGRADIRNSIATGIRNDPTLLTQAKAAVAQAMANAQSGVHGLGDLTDTSDAPPIPEVPTLTAQQQAALDDSATKIGILLSALEVLPEGDDRSATLAKLDQLRQDDVKLKLAILQPRKVWPYLVGLAAAGAIAFYLVKRNRRKGV